MTRKWNVQSHKSSNTHDVWRHIDLELKRGGEPRGLAIHGSIYIVSQVDPNDLDLKIILV